MPKIVNKEEKRQQIVEAALRVFSRQGYHATKIADIAKESGIGKGTVYEYFSKKEDLVTAVFDNLFVIYEMQAQAMKSSDLPPLEAIISYLMGSLDSLHEYSDLILVYLEMYSSQFLNETLGIRDELGQVLENISQGLVPVIKKGQKAGEINTALKPMPLARMLISALDGFAIHVAMFKYDNAFFKQQCVEMERMLRTVLEPK